ncbi:MAG: GNAT family N-acetyltransferase [Rhodospirillum sp.]|nr:GNAT family N-acetyltransferase [Rhodospirillum sp.]MCF8489355.1 GNAT family N-acetyltransferase [Rhodospirillum sp.]MCF8500711.1 GNAT family N-acetyltransferase [Rhodospirillum sp.]
MTDTPVLKAPLPPSGITYRPTTPEDEALLWEFLALAAYSDDLAHLKRQPIAARHVEGWSQNRDGDFGVIALGENGTALGACWSRWLAPEGSPYPEIQARAPDLVLAVKAEARGMGLGENLVRALLALGLGRRPPVTGQCLNVRSTNTARRIYEKVGFKAVPGAEIPNLAGGVSLVMEWRWDGPLPSP